MRQDGIDPLVRHRPDRLGLAGLRPTEAQPNDRLESLGAWLEVNGEAIYGTRAVEPYAEGKLRLTRDRAGAVYLIYLADEGETELPSYISMTELRPSEGAEVTLLGADATIEWERAGSGFVARIPDSVQPPSEHAWVFRISAIDR